MLAAWATLGTPALAAPTALSGNPLTVYVGERGQLQAYRAGSDGGIFFAPSNTLGDAGFFLAFPNPSPAALANKVFGFTGSAGPDGLEEYKPVSQSPATGSGTGSDPLRQVTTYAVAPGAGPNLLEVTHTTTYVNGTQQFALRWDVRNVSGGPVTFKALSAADFFFDGSDRGTGIYTDGPPRFIGGTNADTGNSGGFAEVLSTPWSAYQALEWGSAPEQVWGKVQGSAQSTAATFDNTVVGEPVDNAGGVEWDQFVQTAVPNGQTRSFELIARSAVPSALQLNPSNAGAPKGVPVNITATATSTDGLPYAGRTLRYQITGANPGASSLVLSASGTGTITDPGTNAGNDTIVAFVDFNRDGTRQPAEPQASALATFVDKVAPSCKVKVSGDRPGGGGAGKPLVIKVRCNETARVTTATTLQTIPRVGRRSAKVDAAARRRRPVRIKLKPKTATVAPGRAVPIKIRVPRSVARKYAGKTLKATVRVTAKDAAGNVKRVKRVKRIKLAKIKKKARRRG